MLIIVKLTNVKSKKYHDYHFMLMVKLLEKCLKWSGKFVSRSGKKLGNSFSDF